MVVLALVYVALLLVDQMFPTTGGRDTATSLPIRRGRDQSED
jgi:hypothetical protein